MIIIFLLVIGIIVARIIFTHSPNWEAIGFILGALCGFFLFLCLMSLPINHIAGKGDIERFKAVRATIERARSGENTLAKDFEKAALIHKVAEQNAWLGSTQYWNGTLFDLWIPDAVDELKPIE